MSSLSSTTGGVSGTLVTGATVVAGALLCSEPWSSRVSWLPSSRISATASPDRSRRDPLTIASAIEIHRLEDRPRLPPRLTTRL